MRIAHSACPGRIKPSNLFLLMGLLSLALSACQTFGHERVLYDQQGVRIGLQPDPSVSRSSPPASNAHPAQLTTQEMLVLLGAIRVSGWSGTIVGLFGAPRAIPLFDEGDLRVVAAPITEAFREAAPTERLFFSLPNPKSAYGDATTGALFIRDGSLHVVVTDHKAFARADSAGGDERDLRDTKGMKLGIATPYHATDLTRSGEPDWAPFETVHISLDLQKMPTQSHNGAAGAEEKTQARPSPAGPKPAVATEPTDSPQDLRLQIRELTQSNLDLRDRSNQQTQQLQELKEELTRLRRELDGAKRKTPATRKPSAP